MSPASHRDEFVLDSMAFQLLGHEHGLFKRDVCVFVSMKKHRRRVTLRDVAKWAQRIEDPWLLVWIVPDDFSWPEALLTGVEVESRPRPVWIFGNHMSADGLVGLCLRHGGLPVVKRVRPAIPRPRRCRRSRRTTRRLRVAERAGNRPSGPGSLPPNARPRRCDSDRCETALDRRCAPIDRPPRDPRGSDSAWPGEPADSRLR